MQAQDVQGDGVPHVPRGLREAALLVQPEGGLVDAERGALARSAAGERRPSPLLPHALIRPEPADRR